MPRRVRWLPTRRVLAFQFYSCVYLYLASFKRALESFESAGHLDLDTVPIYPRGDLAGGTPVLHVNLEARLSSGQPDRGSGHARAIDHRLGELAECALHVSDICNDLSLQ